MDKEIFEYIVGGPNLSKIDDIEIITLGSAIRVWMGRCSDFNYSQDLELISYVDSQTKLKQYIPLSSIESITIKTPESLVNTNLGY